MRKAQLQDKLRSIRTHPAPREKKPIPARSFSLAAIRIANRTPPVSCGYSVTYTRDLAASLRAASDAMRAASDAMRDDMRADPAHPARPLRKNAKKTLKKGPKGAENAAKIDKKIDYRRSGVVLQIPGGQIGPELRGAAAGCGDDGLKLRQGRCLIVVDH